MTTPQQPPAYENRSSAFSQGHGMGGSPVASQGLAQDQAKMNSAGPPKVRMTGSGNGMAPSMATATMSGLLPTANGQAENTYEMKKWFEPRQQ